MREYYLPYLHQFHYSHLLATHTLPITCLNHTTDRICDNVRSNHTLRGGRYALLIHEVADSHKVRIADIGVDSHRM
jgi:hypothetical protein